VRAQKIAALQNKVLKLARGYDLWESTIVGAADRVYDYPSKLAGAGLALPQAVQHF
jgi:hypothetical protein